MIHVALAFDENYQNPFLACATSILKNHEQATVEFHLIATSVSFNQKQQIKNWLANEGFTASFYELKDTRVDQLITFSTWTQAVYYRLYFPFLISPTIERLLYLDTDTLVLKNLNEFYAFDLQGYPVAAVYDNYVKTQPLIGIENEGEYFNSGVLLIDLKKWREHKISERTIEYLLKYPQNIRFVDQCGLNHTLKNKWLKLKPSFNLLYSYLPHDGSLTEWKKIESNSTVIHFTLQRPWLMLCKNRFRSLYKENLNACRIKSGSTVIDFSWNKIGAWLRIRINEFYLDSNVLRQLWGIIKPS